MGLLIKTVLAAIARFFNPFSLLHLTELSAVILIVSSSICNAQAGDRVVVIVNGWDPSAGLETPFNQTEELTAKMYAQAGYRVVRLDAQTGAVASDFKTTMAQISAKGVDDLAIIFLTHGALRNSDESFDKRTPLTEEQKKRFPVGYLRKDELATQVTDPSDPITGPVRFAFALQRGDKIPDWNSDFLGLGDLHDSLSRMKSQNPNLKVNITALSCFGASASRALQDIPDVEMFTGGSPSQSSDFSAVKQQMLDLINGYNHATDMHQLKSLTTLSYNDSIDFPKYLFDGLAKGKTYLDAFTDGRQQYQDGKISNMDEFRDVNTGRERIKAYIVRPESSLGLLLSDQCLGGPLRTEVQPFCRTQAETDEMAKIGSLYTRPALLSYLNEQVKADQAYLDKIKVFLACDPAQSRQEAALLHDAIQEGRKAQKQWYASISQLDFDSAVSQLRSKLTQAEQASTAQDLLPLLEDDFQDSNELTQLKYHAENTQYVSSEKFLIIARLRMRIRKLSAPDALSNLQSFTNSQFNDDDKQQSSFQKCLDKPLSCDVKQTLYPGDLTDYLPKDGIEKGLDLKAMNLVANQCPSSGVVGNTPEELRSSRNAQLQCILKNTQSDLLLRAYALSTATFVMSDSDRSASCKLYDGEKAKDDELEKCISNPDGTGNSEFWVEMDSLYLQSQSTLTH